MCIDETNNFVEHDFLVTPLVFTIIDVIGLTESQYIGNWAKMLILVLKVVKSQDKAYKV